MADRRRIVSLSTGGRPVLELDLEVAPNYQAIKDTFAYQAGASNAVTSREPGRYGGAVIVGENNDNGQVSWQALVRGTTADQVAQNVETLLYSAGRPTRDRLLEWRPDGATYSSYFRIAGPMAWKPAYSWAQWQGAQSLVVEITVPVRPLVLWDPMTIGDEFDVDSRGDYTFDASTSADVLLSTGFGNVLKPTGAAVSAERRARHTIRGYHLLEGQVAVVAAPGPTITSFKVGAVLRGQATTYAEVYVDDNGTNSRLRIDIVIAGTRTNRATVNLGARVINNSQLWLWGRIEGQTVYAEYWTTAGGDPGSTDTPNQTLSYILSGGEQSSLVAGDPGWSWVPQDAAAQLVSFAFQPYTYRNQVLPQAITPLDQIPGRAAALADIITRITGGTAPAFGMFSWVSPRAAAPSAPYPFGVLEAEAATLSGWSSSAQAGARGGNDVRVTTAGAATPTASWSVTAGALEFDEFSDGTMDVEVWVRMLVSSTLVNPRLIASLSPFGTLPTLAVQYTHEYGSTGKALVKPSSGSVYRFVRAGILTLTTQVVSANTKITVQGTVDTGSTGVFGFDYAVLCAATRRVASPTGVAKDSSYPLFVPSTQTWLKRVSDDLAGYLSDFGPVAIRDNGLCGSLIQPNPGTVMLLAKLSSLAPDDPTVDTTAEALSHTATVSLDVVPRSYLLRA